MAVKAPGGYPQDPFSGAQKEADALGVEGTSTNGWELAARYEGLSDEHLDALLKIALRLIETFAVNVDFHPLDPTIAATFERNDHNIWAKSVPALAGHVGKWLRGTLADAETEAAIRLEPLAGGQPGWNPRFDSQSTLQLAWSAGQPVGDYVLTVTDAGTPLGDRSQ